MTLPAHGDPEPAQPVAAPGPILVELEREPAACRGRAGEHHLHRRPHAFPGARRPGHDQRPGAFADQLAVQDQERQPAEVIAVQVAQQHRVDGVGRDPVAAHADERGGAAVDEKAGAAAFDQHAGLQAPAAAEGVAAAEKGETHGRHRIARVADRSGRVKSKRKGVLS